MDWLRGGVLVEFKPVEPEHGLDQLGLAIGIGGSICGKQRRQPELQIDVVRACPRVGAEDVAKSCLTQVLLIAPDNQIQMVDGKRGRGVKLSRPASPRSPLVAPAGLAKRVDRGWHVVVGGENGKEINDGLSGKSAYRRRADVLDLMLNAGERQAHFARNPAKHHRPVLVVSNHFGGTAMPTVRIGHGAMLVATGRRTLVHRSADRSPRRRTRTPTEHLARTGPTNPPLGSRSWTAANETETETE